MKVYSTFSKKKESFIPPANTIRIYVCGITPYDITHLGHAFTYISFDFLIRYLKFKGYKVNYTQNVTDINDRDNDILKRAKEKNISWQNLSVFWTKKFLTDMKALNWIMPNNFLYASENIGNMILLIKKLLAKGIAYEIKGNIYLDITKDKNYGKLAGFSKKQMLKIAKEYEEDIENPNKKNALDITLWRATESNQPKHIPSFESPFGFGRPGWHIECSSMAISSLGEQIDIHGGGKDLIFPHHEAEIVQSQNATGKIPFAKFWMHTGIISYKGEKMSKSIGNLVLVSDLINKYDSNALRLLFLSHKYRDDWEFSINDLQEAQGNIIQIKKALGKKLNKRGEYNHIETFKIYMEDDLNTPRVFSLITKIAENINNKKDNSKSSQIALKEMLSILGFKFS